jgi:hypothetical protein
MDKLNIPTLKEYSQLPLNEFDLLRYSIYVLDKEWNYRFVNRFAKENLGPKGLDLIEKNMWVEFPELAVDVAFNKLKANAESGISSNLVTTSPVTGQRLNIIGHSLNDCFLFFSTILPNKADLLNELRHEMSRTNGKG